MSSSKAKKRRSGSSISDKRRFPYVLLRYDGEGNLREPTDDELREIERRFPQVVDAFAPPKPAALPERKGGTPDKKAWSWHDECRKALDMLLKDKQVYFFTEPVDPVALGVPEYLEVITQPMDLGTVKGRLAQGAYSSPHEFNRDVCLTFDNAITFNGGTHPVHLAAARLLVRARASAATRCIPPARASGV